MIAQFIDDDRPDTSGSARTDDVRMDEAVEQALAWHTAVPRAEDIHHRIARTFRQAADVSASRVRVEINGPVAILTGAVRSVDERCEAERIALSTPGISAVEDRLVLVA